MIFREQSKFLRWLSFGFVLTGLTFGINQPLRAQVESDTASSSAAGSTTAAPSGMSSVPGEMDAIEQLYGAEESSSSTGIINDGQKKQSAPGAVGSSGSKTDQEYRGVSELTNLSEFKDVAVIQKRYLPKTYRFEGFGGVGGILNDKFFVNLSFNARLAFSFNERYAIEGVGMLFTTGEKEVTRNLRTSRGVITKNFVSPQSYYGADFKWTPVYGKMSFLNRKITPFDLYLSGGLGITNTNLGGSEPTIHLGTGQLFAFNKSAAFRWDFSWNFYSATSGEDGAKQSSIYNNLMITLGASFFFPEATYR